MSPQRINRQHIFWAIVSGLLLTGAFPKVGISWLAWGALIPLLAAIRDLPARKSFQLGLLAGGIHFLTLTYWLAGTMRTFGGLPWYLCLPVLFLIALYLALYTASFCGLVCRLCRTPWHCIVVVPAVWVSMEFIRAYFLSGFPWELLGHSQYTALRIIQISDIFGVYGISFLVALGNSCLFLVFLFFRKGTWQGQKIRSAHMGVAASVFAGLFCLVWIYGGWRMDHVDRLTVDAPSPKVSVVQGNISQSVKWDPAFRLATTEKYIMLSKTASEHQPDLVVWPETATPFYFLNERRYTNKIIEGVKAIGSDFLIGSPSFQHRQSSVAYRNSAYLLTSGGKVTGQYDKAHLVPFGEYVPFKKWLPFLGKMVEAVGDFEPGQKGDTLPWGRHRLGIQICYEMIFPELSREMVKNGADLLVNITNDAWYGRSSAPYQLFSMAVFRAVENRRTVIRSANTGISGFVDPAGRIMASTPLFQDAVLTRPVPLLKVGTLYCKWGDWFAGACALGVLWLILKQIALTRQKSNRR